MIEQSGDLWNVRADAKVITTNGSIKNNGECVMGRGVALQAKRRFTWLPKALGACLNKYGNHVHFFPLGGYYLVTFPVKHEWHQKANLELIERSARELVMLTDYMGWRRVVLVRPGCGNGGLDWKDVKPVIEPILDDRFIIMQKE